MLFDSKMPILPSGLKAAGTAPKGCASRKALVLWRRVPERPTFPTCTSEDSASSVLESGRASKSHSQEASSFGETPRTSTSIPHRRAAIVAFHTRGLGKYEKIRSSLIIPPEWGCPAFSRFGRSSPSVTVHHVSPNGRSSTLKDQAHRSWWAT